MIIVKKNIHVTMATYQVSTFIYAKIIRNIQDCSRNNSVKRNLHGIHV